MRSLIATTLALASLALLPTSSHAAQAPAAFSKRPAFEVASGMQMRNAVRVSAKAPRQAALAWQKFQSDAGGSWQAIWDQDTGVPSRVFGSGIAAPGSVSDSTLAERYARDLLVRHIALLAPGSKASDFVLIANQVDRGVRSVGFRQQSNGLEVMGGQVSFRFKADRMLAMASEARPYASGKRGSTVDSATLSARARSWILSDSAKGAAVTGNEGPFVLPIIGSGKVEYHTVMAVVVDGKQPLGKWRVYLDAFSGQPIAREQVLHFADASVAFDVPVRDPLSGRGEQPARGLSVLVNGAAQTTSETGGISWGGNNTASVELSVEGPLVQVLNDAGGSAGVTFSVAPNATQVWSESDQELDAQLSSFIHARIAKDKGRELNPELSWLDTKLPVNVNIDDACNAFSDGNAINFFLESSQCANTARLADVVYHEFGHSLHSHSIIDGVGAFDGAMSEGLSDFFAATITEDPAMGIGFFKSEAPLRHIDPDDHENSWPDDVGEIHFTGIIFAGTMWDLRKLLIAKHGDTIGRTLTDRLFYATLQRAANIPATYVEVLVEDDDDGNLANGTPNLCDINAAFGLHGLRLIDAEAGNLSVVSPDQEGYDIELTVKGLSAQCPGDQIASASIDWQLRSDPATGGEQEMSAIDEVYRGTIPAAKDGEVVLYKVAVTFADGTEKRFPDNAADPRYEFYVGEIVELYCTDFESNPFDEGWTHGLSAGEVSDGADDWAWGPSLAEPSAGDPYEAYSGENVIGNDLGGADFNGLYQAQKTNFLLSPTIEVGNYSDVRVQYRRWLNVEDGFFDQATIYSNDLPMWSNFNSDSDSSSTVHHMDREWRFHDVGLTGSVRNGAVQLKYEINSDGGLEMGGWTIDDFCVVANANAICGDGELYGPEECDRGSANSDSEPDGCRKSCLAASCGDGVVDTGEQCDDGNTVDGDGCESTCLLPGYGAGDCGCVVGGERPWSVPHTVLAILGFAGLLLLRRRRAN